jgi:hypothetical protein
MNTDAAYVAEAILYYMFTTLSRFQGEEAPKRLI